MRSLGAERIVVGDPRTRRHLPVPAAVVPMDRGDVDADTLLKVVLVLVVIWLALEVVDTVLDIAFGLLGPLRPLVGLVVLALVALYLLDRL